MTCRSKSATTRIGLGLAVLAAVVLAGCASTGADVAAPAAVPDVPQKQPFEPPAFEASEWRSEEHGFSVHFPSDFAEQPPQPGGLFTAASPMQVPRIDVTAAALPGEVSIDGFASQLEATMAGIGGGEAKVTSSKKVKLRDAVTDAMELVVDWTFQGFPLQSLVLGTQVKEQLISVMVTGMQGGDLAELSGIAYTLYFD